MCESQEVILKLYGMQKTLLARTNEKDKQHWRTDITYLKSYLKTIVIKSVVLQQETTEIQK